MRWIAMLVVMLALIRIPIAVAQQPDSAEFRKLWASADRNQDGLIDRVEFYSIMTDVFFFIDTDKDGEVALAEIQRTYSKIDPSKFEVADADRDGKLNMHEYQNAISIDFAEVDKDDSGIITVQEFNQIYPTP
jgi:Ca2+-binding EF-hand superfamily protein